MSELKLRIPKELEIKIKSYPFINWSAIARQAFLQKVKDIEFLNDFKSQSELTEDDAHKLGKKVNSALYKKYKRLI